VNGDGPVDVLAELERLTARVTSFMDFATRRVEALSPGEWAAFGPRTAAEVDLFRSALRDAGRLLTELARLGLVKQQLDAERERYRNEVHELIGAMTMRAFGATVAELGITTPLDQVKAIMHRHMKAEADRIEADRRAAGYD
jgi:hypothetical protein